MSWSFDAIGRDFQQSVKKILRDYAEALVLALLLALVLRSFVLSTYRVTTDSMAPLLKKGDFILAYKMPYGATLPFATSKFGEVRVHRGEVAIFNCGNAQVDKICVSQIIGVPGDRIEIKQGILWVNEQQVRRSGGSNMELPSTVVPPHSVYVLSQDDTADQDSRSLGPISFEALEARVVWIWFSYWDGPNWSRIGPPLD